MMNRLWISVVFTLFSPLVALSGYDFVDAVKKIEGRFEPPEARPGQLVKFVLTIELNKGWHTYPTYQPNPQLKAVANRILPPESSEVIAVEPIKDPSYETVNLPELGEERLYEGGATWEIPLIVSPKATPGVKRISLKQFRVLVCVKEKGADGVERENCLPQKAVPVSAELRVLDGAPIKFDPKYRYSVHKAIGEPNPEDAVAALVGATAILSLTNQPEIAKDTEDRGTPNKDVGLRIAKDRDYSFDIKAVTAMLPRVETTNAGFIAFVLTAMFWGAVTLLTPCVFPMIPITVSYFLKQGEKKQHNAVAMAIVYTLTIVVVLGVAALFFLNVFQKLSVDPWMNVALGMLFVVFALSLFGMYDIVLPNFLVRFTSAREGKGGYGGVIFMALSFSIVSFTCVAPFLGGFAGMAASGNFSSVQLAAGAFAFAGSFASPFFFLALFPSLIKKLPKSGSWMNTIKVVMGFLELAAALKFFRTAELRWTIPPVLFTYDFVLSLWIVMLVLAGLYLLNLYRLPHDEPQEHIGVTRMLCGLFSISIGLYMLPGLLKQRPAGTIFAWVDAFLLPDPSTAEVVGGGELTWSADLRGAIEEARARGEPVLVDFTGVTCTNCKLNEKDVFPRPEVKELLKKYRLVQLYTDTIPPEFYDEPPDLAQRDRDALANQKLEFDRFQTIQLPLYVILKPEPGLRGGPVKIVGVYKEGLIKNVKEFEKFLKEGAGK